MKELISEVKKSILQFFPHSPNQEQAELIQALSEFTVIPNHPSCFILKGYAGTGKTSLLGAYIQAMKSLKKRTVLLAPTGRAAKVLSGKANTSASTIHKRIYFTEQDSNGAIKMNTAPNKSKNTLFIVDEASMIGDFSVQSDGSVSRNILEDLFQYVFSGENCQLIILGDEGQLPPVGQEESPALNTKYLSNHFPTLNIVVFGLTEVVRQELNSGILFNATLLRNAQKTEIIPTLKLTEFPDVEEMEGNDLLLEIESCYDKYSSEEVMIVTRSNKRANLYNQHVRQRILYMEDELCGGDLLMVVKNNYFWLDPLSTAGFIANGELLRVHRVKRIEEMYQLRFATLEVSLIDYPDMERFEVLSFMQTLNEDTPNLSRETLRTLFFEIEKDFLNERNKQKRYKEIMKNPYFNALQVKFAYAVTCHKSQGGQWKAVFVDHGFVPPEQHDISFLRWMYTACTRASEKLYFVQLMQEFK